MVFLTLPKESFSQYQIGEIGFFISESQVESSSPVQKNYSFQEYSGFPYQSKWENSSPTRIDTVPKPKNVLMQSLILPGWGQITNKQWWKIPIIYGALAGVGYYVYWLDGQYRDFRAGYYNSFASTDPNYSDKKFGETPARLATFPQNALLSYRNYYRNERDFMILMFGLTYGLNVVDAYIFAQLRDFDVSDNLTVQVNPVFQDQITGINFTVKF